MKTNYLNSMWMDLWHKMGRLAPTFSTETELVNEILNADNAFSGKSLSTDDSSGSYINNAAHDPHLYWYGAVEGSAPDYTPHLLLVLVKVSQCQMIKSVMHLKSPVITYQSTKVYVYFYLLCCYDFFGHGPHIGLQMNNS